MKVWLIWHELRTGTWDELLGIFTDDTEARSYAAYLNRSMPGTCRVEPWETIHLLTEILKTKTP